MDDLYNSLPSSPSSFEFLFCDAIKILSLSANKDNLEGTYSRGCISFCAFSIEAVANCCIYHIDMDIPAHKSVADSERNSRPLDKFKKLAGVYEKEFHKGEKRVQVIRELFSIRDDYFAHGKKREIDDKSPFKHLALPSRMRLWKHEHALTVMQGMVDFLN